MSIIVNIFRRIFQHLIRNISDLFAGNTPSVRYTSEADGMNAQENEEMRMSSNSISPATRRGFRSHWYYQRQQEINSFPAAESTR